MAIVKISLVKSGDGKFRYRIVWTKRKFSYFAHPSELRDLARQILLLIKDEPNAIKHLGSENGTGETRHTPTGSSQESAEVNTQSNT